MLRSICIELMFNGVWSVNWSDIFSLATTRPIDMQKSTNGTACAECSAFVDVLNNRFRFGISQIFEYVDNRNNFRVYRRR